MKDKGQVERERAYYERRLAHIQSLIDRGNLSWLTYFRLNRVCDKIKQLDELLGPKPGK